MTAAVDARDVTVRYGDVRALDHASIRLDAGRVCGLVGVNGSGKSTLFKALMGLVRLTSGDVTLFGGRPAASRRAGRIAYMPQGEDVDWTFPVSVKDVVTMSRYHRMGFTRRTTAADRAAVRDAIERVDLDGLASRQIGALSGGQRKRTFVAAAIAQEADLLLLDEPFAGVDVGSAATITRLLRELAAGGSTILVATHDLTGLPALADEAVLLQQRVLLHGHPDEVARPENLAKVFGVGSPTIPPSGAAAEEP